MADSEQPESDRKNFFKDLSRITTNHPAEMDKICHIKAQFACLKLGNIGLRAMGFGREIGLPQTCSHTLSPHDYSEALVFNGVNFSAH